MTNPSTSSRLSNPPEAAPAPGLYDRLLFHASISVFGLGALATNLFFWLLSLCVMGRPGPRLHHFSRRALHRLMRLWMWYLDRSGAMKVNWPDMQRLRDMRGQIVAANHPNLLDICWPIAASPNVVCLYKSEISRNGFLNASARMAGYISNDTGMDGLHRAVEELRKGATLVVFPEGTRTHTFPMNPLKQGFALVAKLSRAPVNTLYIHTCTKSFTKGAFFHCSCMPIWFHLHFGERLIADADKPARAFAQRVEQLMRSDLESGAGLR